MIDAMVTDAGEKIAQDFCLACGYDRRAYDAAGPCPECGARPDESAQARAISHFASPLRRIARVLRVGAPPIGWWSLLPARFALHARGQLIASVVATSVALACFFTAGGHVVALADAGPMAGGGAATGLVTAWTTTELPLAILVHPDAAGRRSPFVAHQSLHLSSHGEVVPRSRVRTRDLVWSPYLAALIAWLSCGPGLAFLAVRFWSIPLVMRWERTPASLRPAVAVAADASVASCCVAFVVLMVAWSASAFALAALAPTWLSEPVARAAPIATAVFLLATPPLLVANEIRGDRSRRVFRSPLLAALVTVVTYVVALALTLALMGVAFRLALWLLS